MGHGQGSNFAWKVGFRRLGLAFACTMEQGLLVFYQLPLKHLTIKCSSVLWAASLYFVSMEVPAGGYAVVAV
jgi:hypothetical protein